MHFWVWQGQQEVVAASAAEVLRREQLAIKQSKQLVPLVAPVSKSKLFGARPASAGTAASAPHAGGGRSLLQQNGTGGPTVRKSGSLEGLWRTNGQPLGHVRCPLLMTNQRQ